MNVPKRKNRQNRRMVKIYDYVIDRMGKDNRVDPKDVAKEMKVTTREVGMLLPEVFLLYDLKTKRVWKWDPAIKHRVLYYEIVR